jgi:hypothetical protein
VAVVSHGSETNGLIKVPRGRLGTSDLIPSIPRAVRTDPFHLVNSSTMRSA